MSTRARRVLVPGLAALALMLAGCGDDSGDDSTGEPSPAEDAAETTPAEPDTSGDATTDDAGDDDSGDDASAGGAAQAPLAAIDTAEAEAGGTAYAIDADDGSQTWDVDVATGDSSVEVAVTADGSEVLGREEDDDLDEDDRAGLAAADVGIGDAIESALNEVDGDFDDAELTDDDGPFAWEVTIDTDEQDDVDVYVDVATGDVLRVERDD